MKRSNPKILYLTRGYSSYQSASYQTEIIRHLTAIPTLHIFEVPTYFTKKKNEKHESLKASEEKLKKIYANYDIIFFGHNWLGDSPSPGAIYPAGFEFIKDINIKKIAFINKEYSRFKDKVNYFKYLNCDTLVSHHSNIDSFFESHNIRNEFKIIFIPFAVESSIWFDQEHYLNKKIYDIFFSGTTLNPTWGPTIKENSDQKIRVKVEKLMFKKIFGIRIKSKHENIYWNTFVGNRFIDWMNMYSKLNINEYIKKMSQSSVVFNTTSFGLITPRTYESMAVGAVPLLAEDDKYSKIQGLNELCIFFKSDLSNFHDQWEKAISLGNNDTHKRNLSEEIRLNHCWSNRITSLMDQLLSFY